MICNRVQGFLTCRNFSSQVYSQHVIIFLLSLIRPTFSTMAGTSKHRGFRPFAGLVSWWKRRRFYVAQNNTLDEESATISDHQDSLDASNETDNVSESVPSAAIFHPGFVPQLNRQGPFSRSRTIDSFQGSLESMDSLVESYWDPDDDMSQTTEVASNSFRPLDFFCQHLSFLTQTQPRQVAEISSSTQGFVLADHEFIA